MHHIRSMTYLEFLNKVSIELYETHSLVLLSVMGWKARIMHKSSRVWAWDRVVDLMLRLFLFQVPRRLTGAGIRFLLYPMTYAQMKHCCCCSRAAYRKGIQNIRKRIRRQQKIVSRTGAIN